ncbi:hypothetical protein TNCV_2566961 [Trichonephila clavipes]|uniref:Mos1 transposase HTH domain-containing protein n=1 Tax=Trichonephila clavipes TaxID=2585209 RepID=A0A8X6WM15_TRICX|nr:hypothetical protein TNCV_2566961 [Trichonephila clavipes]
MSAYVPNSRHLRKVLIFCFNMKKSAAEAHRMLSNTYVKQPALQAMTKTRALSALINSERVLSTRVFKSGEGTSKSSYAEGGLTCPGRKFTPTDT